MDTKKILWTVTLAVLFWACDPHNTGKDYFFKNNTNTEIIITLYENSQNNSHQLSANSDIIIKEVRGLGTGGFGDIGIFKSVELKIVESGKILKWENPGGVGYIDIDNNIGTDRNVPKDFYNKKYWKFKTIGDDEEWSFIINEEDLNLFE